MKLDSKTWLAEVKQILKKTPYTRFLKKDEGVYIVPVFKWDYLDLVSEVFGKEDPRKLEEPTLKEQGDLKYRTKYISEEELSEVDILKEQILPEVESLAESINASLGEDHFVVEFLRKESLIEVLFIFAPEEIEGLKSKNILSATPLLSSLLIGLAK